MEKATGTAHSQLRLFVRGESLAICRLAPDQKAPDWALESKFFSLTRTPDEISVVCPESSVPAEVTCERGWRAIGIEGPLDFSLVGVLAGIMAPLAEAEISAFAVSTYDTDYVLVREDMLESAIANLHKVGHQVRDTKVVVRPATANDESFLWEMLYEAVHRGPEETGPKLPPEELLSEPGLRRYLGDWGRGNDFAVVALDVEDGDRIGAAWYRTFSAHDPGYGFVDEATPEIAIAVVSDRRGAGIGRALLRALMDAARLNGFEAISLSVQKSNHAAAKLYERNGFFRLREDEGSWVMKVELPVNETTNRVPSAPRTEE